MKKLITHLFCAILFLSLAGCGYHAVDWNSSPYSGAGKRMNIALFGNRTFKPNLEGVVTNALVDEFAKKARLTLDSGNPDLILSGEVLSYTSTASAYSAADTVKEYMAYMKIGAVLTRNSNKEVLWKGELDWNQSFPASQNIALQQNAEDAAIVEISRKLARELFVVLSEGF